MEPYAACSSAKEPTTGPKIKGLCASALPAEQVVPMPLPPPPAVERRRSRACPFPHEADKKRITFAESSIQVLVGPDGTARDVRILADPGYGFAQAAAGCAYAVLFSPTLDTRGLAVPAWTPPICVRFIRE